MLRPGEASPNASVGLPDDFSVACAALEARLAALPLDLLPEGAAAVAGALERARTRVLMGLAAKQTSDPTPVPAAAGGPLLDVSELAGRLGRSADWVYRHLPEIPHSRLGRGIRFSEAQVCRYLDRNQKSA